MAQQQGLQEAERVQLRTLSALYTTGSVLPCSCISD
jgi:hypothetical protein